MSIYPAIASAILPNLPQFNVLSTANPQVYRTTPGTPSEDATTASVGTRRCYIIPNTGSRMQQAAAGVGVWAADWLAVAKKTVDLLAQDIVTDGTKAFVLTATPDTTFGLLIAPAEPTGLPA